MIASTPSPIKLTELTDCGGCAAKLGADLLADALAGLGAEPVPADLIAGLAPPDDGAVYRISDELAIIGTLDFFPPLSMTRGRSGDRGGQCALGRVRDGRAGALRAVHRGLPGRPAAGHADRDLRGCLEQGSRGGRRAGGGHTIRDAEPKYGLAVVGAAHPERLLRKGGARPGDQLVLTKRLGTGIIVSGGRQGKARAEDLAAAVAQMRTLNRVASEVLVANGVRGATDVTGFGLLGHGLEMARTSGTSLTFSAAALPALPGALSLARAGVETGGAAHNRRYVAGSLSVADGVAPELVTLAHDPQTSGGLLAAVPTDDVSRISTTRWRSAGVERWWIGHVTAPSDGSQPGVALSA